jgi:protein-disulfide isomerase/uncharacterized membrane protein
MSSPLYLYTIRSLALVALGVSSALVVNSLRPAPDLCSYDSGCRQVLSSGLGPALPALGVLAFGAVFLLTFRRAASTPRLLRWMGVAAAGVGVVLILVQALVLGHVCPYCLMVDSAAIALGLIGLIGPGEQPLPVGGQRARLGWSSAAAVALLAGLAAGTPRSHGQSGQADAVPTEIRSLWVPGKVNVVEAVDFQCPQCRRMHGIVEQLLAEEGERLHFIQLPVPMRGHEQARDAARAFLCAGEQGKAEVMAQALFAARRLRPQDCERLASFLCLSITRYRACTARWDIDQQLDDNLAWVKSASPEGLPVIWIQERRLSGLQPLHVFREAVEAAHVQLSLPRVR